MERLKPLYNPDHPNANIHGMVGPDGEPTCFVDENALVRCTGCCWAGYVPELVKDAGEMCGYQEPKNGCLLILKDTLKDTLSYRPKRCFDYHCSQDKRIVRNSNAPIKKRLHALQRITLSNEACFVNQEISKEQRDKNLQNHIPQIPFFRDTL